MESVEGYLILIQDYNEVLIAMSVYINVKPYSEIWFNCKENMLLSLLTTEDERYRDYVINNGYMYVWERYDLKSIILYFMIQVVGSKLAYNLVYMLYLVYKTVVLNALSISSMVVLFNSTNSLRQGFIGLTEIIPSMMVNSMYIDKVYNFLALEPCLKTEGNLDVPQDEGVIEFQDVSFAYPNAEKNSISHLNLQFFLKDSIAIVGYNGTGKTTIIKLLLRFYDPTEGRILLNGIDIKEYNIEQYRALFSAIFQDYNMYAISIYENIAMDFVQENEKKQIDAILHKFGCDRLLEKRVYLLRAFTPKNLMKRVLIFPVEKFKNSY